MQQNMDTIALTGDVKLKKTGKRLEPRRKLLCFSGVFVVVILVVCSVCLGVFFRNDEHKHKNEVIGLCGTTEFMEKYRICSDFSTVNCNITLIESIPENLTYPHSAPSHPSIYSSWIKLLDAAQSTIYIASSYWSLRSEDLPVKDPSSWQGQDIFNKLIDAGKRGDV